MTVRELSDIEFAIGDEAPCFDCGGDGMCCDCGGIRVCSSCDGAGCGWCDFTGECDAGDCDGWCHTCEVWRDKPAANQLPLAVADAPTAQPSEEETTA